jgi:hypothetical protein
LQKVVFDYSHSRGIVVPDLDHPLGATSEEDGWNVLIPGNVVDGRVVRGISLQILGAVLSRAFVDKSLVGAHEEHTAVVGVEGHAPTALLNNKSNFNFFKFFPGIGKYLQDD